MSHPIISARSISKRYRLGATHGHDTLRDRITHSLRGMLSGKSETKSDEILWALKDVSFDIQQGEVIGVIGRNGAGKSTLLKILSRITEPTSGEIRVRGRLASLLEVGTGFHPELTGRENIFLNGAILGMRQSEVRKKFDAIIAFADIEKFLDTPIKRYSSGMYVRLAFAVAAHLEPEILVVDEVLAVGDAQFQSKCLGKMGEVAQQGRTVLFVSHNMAAVRGLCQKAFYIEQGELKQTGKVDEIIARYISGFAGEGTATFTAASRKTSGAVRITDLKISSADAPGTAVCGLKNVVTISYEADHDNLPIQFLLGFYDSFKACPIFLDSATVKNLPAEFPRKGRLELEFENEFSLYPGRYTLNIAAMVRGQMADYIPQALAFTVQEGDFFGTGKMPTAKASVLYRNKWTLHPS